MHSSPRQLILGLIFLLPNLAFGINLFDFSMYTTSGIDAFEADIQGAVASSGDIAMTDYAIDSSKSISQYTLIGEKNIVLNRTSIGKYDEYNQNIGLLYANEPYIYNSGDVAKRTYQKPDFEKLKRQMRDLEQKILALPDQRDRLDITNHSISFHQSSDDLVKISLQAIELKNLGKATFFGRYDQTVIFEVSGTNAEIMNTGFELRGLQKENVLFYFKDALDVIIGFSGYVGDLYKPIENRNGIPFSILAPKALVAFFNSLLTGAIYAEQFYSPWHGQINYGHFDASKLLNNSAPSKSPSSPQQAFPPSQNQDLRANDKVRKDTRTPDQIWNSHQ